MPPSFHLNTARWGHCALPLFALLIIAFASHSFAAPDPKTGEDSATIRLNADKPGSQIPSDFSGLSFEAGLVMANSNGVHYFRPDNRPLLHLFHQLGIRNLRIGGNTSDRNAKQLPGEADFDSLFGFAKAADLKVIYCLRLHNGDPAETARTAKYIMDRYAPFVECFSIGQEPSAYPVEKVDNRPALERMGTAAEKYSYSAYHDEWKRFADAIIAAAPNVKFCGPAVHNNATWARNFIKDFGHSNHVTMCVMHLYPGGAGNKVPSPEVGRDRLLSGELLKPCEKLHDGFVPMALSNGLPYRLEEVNNFFNGGASDVSDTFASALWGLEFMHWWAAHDAAGLNFHSGDRVAAGSSLRPSRYTAYHSTTNGYRVRPLGYALKAFDLACHGRTIPADMVANSGSNLSAYAVLAETSTLFVTVINKQHGQDAHPMNVALTVGERYASGQFMLLSSPGDDVAAKSGITLGGAGIAEDATWNGQWSPLHQGGTPGAFAVKLPPASAAVVKLLPK